MQSKFSELFPIKGFLNLLFAQHCLVHCRAGGLLPRRIERPDIDGEDDVDDDPIGPVKEKSRDIADFNIFDRDQEYNPFRI